MKNKMVHYEAFLPGVLNNFCETFVAREEYQSTILFNQCAQRSVAYNSIEEEIKKLKDALELNIERTEKLEAELKIAADELAFLRTISESFVEMGNLIDALLSFSRLGRADLKRTLINSSELVAHVLNSFSDELAGKLKMTL